MTRRQTRRKIAELRADAKRRQRTSFTYLPVRWSASSLTFWSALCFVVLVAAITGMWTGLAGYYFVACATFPVWYVMPILLERATRPFLRWYLLNSDEYNFWRLYYQTGIQLDKPQRQLLREACEQGTLQHLEFAAAGFLMDMPEVVTKMRPLEARARELAENKSPV